MSVSWNPWHGCRKISEGCRHCYVYRQDAAHDKDSSRIRRTAAFDLPVRRSRDGRFRVPAGERVYTCFTSDFLVEEADPWRAQAWAMMRLRSDLRFFFITKRIDRLAECLPDDWGDGYENVAVGCTVEMQETADRRLPIFRAAPIRHKLVICAPLLGPIDLAAQLDPAFEEVSVGGESGADARICDYDWILDIRRQCAERNIGRPTPKRRPALPHSPGAPTCAGPPCRHRLQTAALTPRPAESGATAPSDHQVLKIHATGTPVSGKPETAVRFAPTPPHTLSRKAAAPLCSRGSHTSPAAHPASEDGPAAAETCVQTAAPADDPPVCVSAASTHEKPRIRTGHRASFSNRVGCQSSISITRNCLSNFTSNPLPSLTS